MNRRSFLRASAAAAAVLIGETAYPADDERKPNVAGRSASIQNRICLFTDHLDDFGYSFAEVAAMLKRLGVAGPDLTVRPGGLVAPERVADELPRAAAVFADQGLSIPMISTGLLSVADPAAAATLETMSKLNIKYFKPGYYHYGELADWRARLDATRADLLGLVELGGRHGVQAGFHNHAGPVVGGALWDSWEIIEPLNAQWAGFYFDPAQATIEGGQHAWKLGFQRLSRRLKMIAIKDFIWQKVDGKWRTRWCPLGEGMVDWPAFFQLLAAAPFNGPISLHIEYDPGGDTRQARYQHSLAAAERDLAVLRTQLELAFNSADAPSKGNDHR